MAFNYRPKTSKEILDKKKTNSIAAAMVFESVMDKYGEGIILDPATNFQAIKVPRAVGDEVNITQLKTFLKTKKIDISGLKISFGDGSGVGKGTNANVTAMQENSTRLYCETYLNTGKFPKSKDLKKIYPDVNDLWYKTFENQAITIKKWLGSGKYNFSRDSGIMPFIEGAAKKCGVSTIDNWNPADIYAVLASKEPTIKREITAIVDSNLDASAKLDQLNEYMREKIIAKHLVGISLKLLKNGEVKVVELSNATKRKQIKDISVVPGSVKLDLDLNKDHMFNTGEMSFKINVEGSEINVQIRASSGGIRERAQMDMTGVGAAAKLGKVSATQAIDPYLNKFSLQRGSGQTQPNPGRWTDQDIRKYVTEQKQIANVKIDGQPIYWGKDNWEKTLKKAVVYEEDIQRTGSQLSTKLQCFQWVKIFDAIAKKRKTKEFLMVLYYGAKKEYDTAGPFLKVA